MASSSVCVLRVCIVDVRPQPSVRQTKYRTVAVRYLARLHCSDSSAVQIVKSVTRVSHVMYIGLQVYAYTLSKYSRSDNEFHLLNECHYTECRFTGVRPNSCADALQQNRPARLHYLSVQIMTGPKHDTVR